MGKALRRRHHLQSLLAVSVLLENNTPKKIVTDTMLSAPKSGAFKMHLTRPLLIYSRIDLNRMLLNRAEAAGAELEKERVLGLDRGSNNWRIRTRSGTIDADYCVVATGARNPLRDVGTQYTAEDTMYALGYWVPTDQAHIDIQFLPNLEGYIWVFPRAGPSFGWHLRQGRIGAVLARSAGTLHGRNAAFRAARLSSMATCCLLWNRAAGATIAWPAMGGLPLGDAGGLVDPITGEGLYYAIRSGDLASQILLNDLEPVQECRRIPAADHPRFRSRSHLWLLLWPNGSSAAQSALAQCPAA